MVRLLWTKRERHLVLVTLVSWTLTLCALIICWQQTPAPFPSPPTWAGPQPPVANPSPTESKREGKEAAPSSLTSLVVDVKGAVRKPGVYRLAGGARVYEALQAAGGLQATAQLAQLNQARPLQDGQAICVPTADRSVCPVGEEKEGAEDNGQGRVAVNTASATELQKLSGIGQAKALAIIRYRKEQGPFRTSQDLEKVPGIGKSTAQRLAEQLQFSV